MVSSFIPYELGLQTPELFEGSLGKRRLLYNRRRGMPRYAQFPVDNRMAIWSNYWNYTIITFVWFLPRHCIWMFQGPYGLPKWSKYLGFGDVFGPLKAEPQEVFGDPNTFSQGIWKIGVNGNLSWKMCLSNVPCMEYVPIHLHHLP